MSAQTDSIIQSLITNVVNEKRFSHCRLCLKFIGKHFVRFNDLVSLDTTVGDFLPLSTILTQLFGEDLAREEIPGIEAICPDCVDKCLETLRFLEMCKNANKKLHTVLDNLVETLNAEIDVSSQDQTLYVLIEKEESKLILVKKKNKAKEGMNPKQMFCFQCDQDFPDLEELKKHNLSVHDHLTCETCYETYIHNGELIYHISNVHKYECQHCHIRKDTEDQLNQHIDDAHTVYVCKACDVACEGKDKLRSHEHKHSNTSKRNQCPKCGKIYSTKEFFQKHVKLCMEDRIDPHPIRTEIVKKFLCNLCGKGYSSYGGLRVHNRFVHGDAKPHVCEQCGKEFTAPSYLKTHMIKHTGEKNFKCDICGNKFVSKEALLYHTRRHTGEKPYSCKHCSERFVNASARAEHIKFKHVGPTLMCEICSQKFVTSNFLKQHMNRHRDSTSKLYTSRSLPANMPGEENYKIKVKN